MLKEVDASGQISLGKKYGGRLFDAVFYPDGRVELVPMKAVPAVQDVTTRARVQEEAGPYRAGDGWLTPERLAARKEALERSPEEIERLAVQWEADNKDAIDAYNRRIEREGSVGWRIYEWRKKQVASKTPGAETC